MDSDTLHTASTYLNNLLLARGLLRNGKALDFAKPTRDTRAQIINLVHELLLRRDRDQEGREQIALTLRTLRADETRKDGELEKCKLRVEEKERSLLQAQAESRNMKVEMRRVETSLKNLQDQHAKLKVSVSHIKTQCANDIRKRDTQIERLKTHVQGQQRGNKRGVVAPMMNMTGGSGNQARFHASVRDIQDPEYSLKQETTEFLTQLGQSLSDENDGLISMLQGTLHTMKDLLGLDHHESDHIEGEDDSTMSYNEEEPAPLSYEALAAELESTLEVLKSVLTSPNFVSMDEVESRDEEIMRLRDGWEKMETRWREVLVMMNTWRSKMEKTGDTINLDDLKRGLGLGEGLDPLPQPKGDDRPDSAKSDTNISPDSNTTSVRGDSGIGDRSPPSSAKNQPRNALEPPELFHQRHHKDRRLRNISHNAQSPRKVAFADDLGKTSPLSSTGQSSIDTPARNHGLSEIKPLSIKSLSEQRFSSRTARPGSKTTDRVAQSSPQRERRDIFSASEVDFHDRQSPIFVEEEGQARLTVEEKLRAVQLEADQAVSAAQCMHNQDSQPAEPAQVDLELDEEISKLRSPAKKTRIKGRPKRRKSTLSAEELESLLGLE